MQEFSSNFRLPTTVELEVFLKARLKGQDQAIQAVARHYGAFRSGLKSLNETDKKRPIGVFFWLGPSGVGKSELGRLVAQAIYGTQEAAVCFDMENFTREHTVARFIGSPPGYIGSDKPAELSPEKIFARISRTQGGRKKDEDERDSQGRRVILVSLKDALEIKERDQSLAIGQLSLWLTELDMADRTLEEKQSELEVLGLRLSELEKEYDILKEAKSSTAKVEKQTNIVLRDIAGVRANIHHLEMRKKQVFVSYLFALMDRFAEWSVRSKETIRAIKENLEEKKETKEIQKAKNESPEEKPALPVLILIFNEFEKAHSDVHNFFLNAMLEGRVVLSNGEELDLSHAMIFFTSNVGSDKISRIIRGGGQEIGFVHQGIKDSIVAEAKKELRKKFSPEFLNRVDEIVVFNNLPDKVLFEVLELQLKDFEVGLQKLQIQLKIDEEVKKLVVSQSKLEPEGQAHGLLAKFKSLVKIPISQLLEKEEAVKGKIVKVSLKDGKIVFDIV